MNDQPRGTTYAGMKIKSIWLRKVHKWIGLIIAQQFLLWAISETAMALLDIEGVAGGPISERATVTPVAPGNGWPRVAGRSYLSRFQKPPCALRLAP